MTRRSVLRMARISLLLCVGVAWLWSYAATPAVVHQRLGRTSGLIAYRGRVLLETAGRNDARVWPGLRALRDVRVINQPSETLYLDDPGLRPGGVFGFQGYLRANATHRMTAVTVPLWAVASLILLPSGVGWGRQYVEHRRRRRGQCAACGYDLRATPGQCPECGAVSESAAGEAPHNPPMHRTGPAV